MLAPYRWICDYADVQSEPAGLAEKMVMTGNGVEGIEYLGENIVNVVVGKIEKIEKHPDADKLVVCRLDVGEEELLQIVTGADNVFEGAYVPVAKAVATLPAGTIKKGKLRGVTSMGMLCSGEELELTEADWPGAGVDGILILQDEPHPGMDIREYFSLSGAVIEFEVGANRPDCLSILGIAREAAAADGVSFKAPGVDYTEQGPKTEDLVSVRVDDTDLCTRYIAAAVTDVKIGPSPDWMRLRLREAGIRPINNIVDITNFVMLETGQPMHAFDAADIRGKQIIVRRAKAGETMTTLDDKEREFDEDMLLICDAQGPVGIAGVMGGQNSEIKNTTSTVVFEAAKFLYGNVRRTSRSLGMATESSMRFSKGVDAVGTLQAMKRALALVDQLGAGKVAQGMIDVLNEDLSPRIIKVTASAVNSILGTEISAKEMQQLLTHVFINTGLIGEEMICTIPSFRGDIEGGHHIAEEVARMYGYDNIPPTQARLWLRPGNLSESEHKTDLVKRYLVDAGFMEAVTYSFTGAPDYEKLSIEMPQSVKLLNPLGDDSGYMRTTLVPHMLKVVAHNLKHKNLDLKLFEAGRAYIPQDGGTLPAEVPMLCMAMSGTGYDFFTMKGLLENIVKLVCGGELACKPADEPYLHPGISARLLANGTDVGFMGAVHPDAKERFELPQDVLVAQVNLNALYAVPREAFSFRALPRFPSAARDIAVIVDEAAGAGDVMEAIKKAAGNRCERVQLFDVYEGEQLGAGKKSLAYSLTLRATDATLTDAEIDAVMDKVLKALQAEFGAALRA